MLDVFRWAYDGSARRRSPSDDEVTNGLGQKSRDKLLNGYFYNQGEALVELQSRQSIAGSIESISTTTTGTVTASKYGWLSGFWVSSGTEDIIWRKQVISFSVNSGVVLEHYIEIEIPSSSIRNMMLSTDDYYAFFLKPQTSVLLDMVGVRTDAIARTYKVGESGRVNSFASAGFCLHPIPDDDYGLGVTRDVKVGDLSSVYPAVFKYMIPGGIV